MRMLERRVTLLGVLRSALRRADVFVRIGARERGAGAALARARRPPTTASPQRNARHRVA